MKEMPTGKYRILRAWDFNTDRPQQDREIDETSFFTYDLSCTRKDHSQVELEWLEWRSHVEFCQSDETSGQCKRADCRDMIWHRFNGKQKVIHVDTNTRYYPDGYRPPSPASASSDGKATVYEFLGCHWHGHRESLLCYTPSFMTPCGPDDDMSGCGDDEDSSMNVGLLRAMEATMQAYDRTTTKLRWYRVSIRVDFTVVIVDGVLLCLF